MIFEHIWTLGKLKQSVQSWILLWSDVTWGWLRPSHWSSGHKGRVEGWRQCHHQGAKRERERDTSTHTHTYNIILFLLVNYFTLFYDSLNIASHHSYIFIPWAGGLHPAFAGGKEPHCNPHPELRVAASSGRKGGSERFPGHRGQAALWLLSWQACRSEGTEENRGDLQRHDPQVLCGALPRCGPRYCEGHHRSQSLSMSQHVSAISVLRLSDFPARLQYVTVFCSGGDRIFLETLESLKPMASHGDPKALEPKPKSQLP